MHIIKYDLLSRRKTIKQIVPELKTFMSSSMLLEADYIHVDWTKNILNAVKKANRLPTVTTYGGDPMQGDSLKYNLFDKHGTIYKGKTKVDDVLRKRQPPLNRINFL